MSHVHIDCLVTNLSSNSEFFLGLHSALFLQCFIRASNKQKNIPPTIHGNIYFKKCFVGMIFIYLLIYLFLYLFNIF